MLISAKAYKKSVYLWTQKSRSFWSGIPSAMFAIELPAKTYPLNDSPAIICLVLELTQFAGTSEGSY